ncbi:MAG: glycoside hydrolase family 5 protein [Lachnospiraceae bacterium]|nr:glycoside hydrolase family 5 protein [Lachnospiraceae bacterium]
MREWKGFKKGINLGGWFSQNDHEEKTYDTFITESDFKIFSKWGIDHVRIPIDYHLLEDAKGEHLESGFKRIDNAVSLCTKYGLNVILDMHRVYGFSFFKGYGEFGFFEDSSIQERYYKLWEAIAARYGKYHGHVAFELLNEITEQSYSESWNRIARLCIGRIRKIAPETDIVVGSYWNNSILALSDLNIRVDDHIIYTFHCYEPLIFTHQGADWIDEMSLDYRYSIIDKTYEQINEDFGRDFKGWFANRILAPGGSDDPVFGKDYFVSMFSSAINLAEKLNVPLYCGEYGVIKYCDPLDQLYWFKAIHEAFEEYDIGRAVWTYKEYHFGIIDKGLDGIRDELIKYF